MTRLRTLEQATRLIGRERLMSYTDCYLSDWYTPNYVLIVSRTSHCGGTEKTWLGVVTPEDADTLAASGVADRRSKPKEDAGAASAV